MVDMQRIKTSTFLLAMIAMVLSVRAQSCTGFKAAIPLVQSSYVISYADPYLRFPSWPTRSPAGAVGTACPFTSYVVTTQPTIGGPSLTKPPLDTMIFPSGQAVAQSNGTWAFKAGDPPNPPPDAPSPASLHIVGITDDGVQSASTPISVTLILGQTTNPCSSAGATSSYPNGVETGLALNTNSPTTDNNAGKISILISQTVTFTTYSSACQVSNVAVVNVEPTDTVPYSESLLSPANILVNALPNIVALQWSLYVAKCSQFYLYAVLPNQIKSAVTPVKVCTCGQETIRVRSLSSLSLIYLIGTSTSTQMATSNQLKGLFNVDTSMNLAACGIVTLELTSDTNGTAFITADVNNYITLNSGNSLTIPTYRELSRTSFYVKATTLGGLHAYKQITVRVTKCGSEVLTSNYPYYWNITVPFQSGLYKTQALGNHFLHDLFSSSVSFSDCPITWFQLQPYSDSDFLTRNGNQVVYSGTKFGPDLPTQVYLTKGNYIEVDTNAFSSAQTYFVDLAVRSSGGYVALTSIMVNITLPPTHINMPPNFALPLENVRVDAYDMSAYQYVSPFAYDPESNSIDVDVDTSARTPSCGKVCFQAIPATAFFMIIIQRGVLTEADSGVYPVKVTLSDPVTKLKSVNKFNLTLVVPGKKFRIQTTQTEIFNAAKGQLASAPNFFALKQSLDGLNAYNVYTVQVSSGLEPTLTYSTFPAAITAVSKSSTALTAVVVASYTSNSVDQAQAQAAAAAVQLQAQSTIQVEVQQVAQTKIQGAIKSIQNQGQNTISTAPTSPVTQDGGEKSGGAEAPSKSAPSVGSQASEGDGQTTGQQRSSSESTPSGGSIQSTVQGAASSGEQSESGGGSSSSPISGGTSSKMSSDSSSKQPVESNNEQKSSNPASGQQKSSSNSPSESQAGQSNSPSNSQPSQAPTTSQAAQPQQTPNTQKIKPAQINPVTLVSSSKMKKKIDDYGKQMAELRAILEAQGTATTVEPTKIVEPVINREGVVEFKFNQKVIVPSFLNVNSTESNVRRLKTESVEIDINSNQNQTNDQQKIALSQINVNKDIIAVDFYLNSQVNQSDIQYTLQLLDWTPLELKLYINFSDPTLISQGTIRDEVLFKIINPYLFISVETGLPLDESSQSLVQALPRQLPKGISEIQLIKAAGRAKDAMTVVIIVQIIMQAFLKGVIEDLWGLYFTLQLCAYLTLLNVSIPGNAEIYIQQFRELVDFDVFKPDSLLPLINKNWSVAYFVGVGKAQVNGNLAATGVTSGNIMYNLQTYILFLMLFVFVMLILLILMIVKRFRSKIQVIIIKILEKTFFNNLVRSINLSYLKSALAFVVAIEAFNESDENRLSKNGLIAYIPLIVHASIPVICFLAIYKYQERLHEQGMKDRIEKMFVEVNLQRNLWTKYIYPVFLARRLLFVIIPIVFPDAQYFQLIFFCVLSLLHAMYYFGTAPHQTLKKRIIEGTNDVLILVMSYHLFCFTWFVQDLGTQYFIGQSFIIFYMIIIFVNLGYMVNNVYHRCISKRRKKRYQKAYEARFADFQARVEVAKDIKQKFNCLRLQAKDQILTKYHDQIFYLRKRTRIKFIKKDIEWAKLPLSQIREESDGNHSIAEKDLKVSSNPQTIPDTTKGGFVFELIPPQYEAHSRIIDDATVLEPSIEEEIKNLYQISHLVKIEGLFDKELLNNIDQQSLEICVLQEQKIRILNQMTQEIDVKRAELQNKEKKDYQYQIEFLELNYKYLETLSNNVMKKARRKMVKRCRHNSRNMGGLEFEYQVTCQAIQMEIFILKKEQKRLLETENNIEIFERNIAKFDVLNNCVKLEEAAFRPIFEEQHSLASSEEDEQVAFPDQFPNMISTRADIKESPSNSENNENRPLIPEESIDLLNQNDRISSLMERGFTQVSAVFSDNKKQKINSLDKSKEEGKNQNLIKSGDSVADCASFALTLGLVSSALNDATIGRLKNQIEEDSNESEGSAPEIFENVVDEIQAIVTAQTAS